MPKAGEQLGKPVEPPKKISSESEPIRFSPYAMPAGPQAEPGVPQKLELNTPY
jgi:hypothetical protein